MVEYKIKGHEKFSVREGWITKGLQGVVDDPRIFYAFDGPDKLGVGTNMVKSIRYWLQAFNLIVEDQRNGARLSDLGTAVYQYDMFIEDPFTIWMLQSQIAKNSSRATTWFLFFNKCEAEEFRKEELFEVIKKELIVYAETNSIPDNSLKDDIDVLLNMYSKTNEFDDPEDKNKSPIANLGLIKKNKDIYIRKQPDLRILNSSVVLYELCELMENNQSISIDSIAKRVKSIYHLNRVVLNNYLDYLENLNYIKVDRTAGLDVIYPINRKTKINVIIDYYQSR